jgi:hypothetical protein
MAEPILNASGVVASIGRGVAAAVAQHVGVDFRQSGSPADAFCLWRGLGSRPGSIMRFMQATCCAMPAATSLVDALGAGLLTARTLLGRTSQRAPAASARLAPASACGPKTARSSTH